MHPIALAGALAALAALHLVAAHAVHRLRCQADVTHDRDVDAGDGADRIGHVDAAFELHRVDVAFLDQAPGVVQRASVDADLIGEERQVAHQQGAAAGASDHATMVDRSRPSSPARWSRGLARPCRGSRRPESCRRRPRRRGGANGKSYAVRATIGSPPPLRLRISGTVTLRSIKNSSFGSRSEDARAQPVVSSPPGRIWPESEPVAQCGCSTRIAVSASRNPKCLLRLGPSPDSVGITWIQAVCSVALLAPSP